MTRRWFELLMDDHAMTERVLDGVERLLACPVAPAPSFIADAAEYLSAFADECHNRKEEEHLFPRIETLGIPRNGGPLAVMLAEHERVRVLVGCLKEAATRYAGSEPSGLDAFGQAFREYAGILKDHYWKENDILYPMAIRVMGPADEQAVLDGIAATEARLGPGGRARFETLAARIAQAGEVKDLSHGLDRDVLAAMLNTLPVEISFVDANDEVRYFSHEKFDKIFPRSRNAIGLNVENCHPPKSVQTVKRILEDFRAGKRDVAEFWMDFREMKVHIRYFAVRGQGAEYLGCMEVVQDVTGIQRLEGQRRLLDE